jgi:diadenosine tetraphosphate (Ap4A) HIT family hydrolase
LKREWSFTIYIYQPVMLKTPMQSKEKILSSYSMVVTGFNVGFNDGRDAGQTVMHCHIFI